jgi:hypothetical protein
MRLGKGRTGEQPEHGTQHELRVRTARDVEWIWARQVGTGEGDAMTEFKLDHPEVAQPKLLDEEIAASKWPLPEPKAWAPIRDESLMGRAARIFDVTAGWWRW